MYAYGIDRKKQTGKKMLEESFYVPEKSMLENKVRGR